MRGCPLSLFVGAVLVMSGCGGRNSTTTTSGTPVSVSGNYELAAASQSSPGINFFVRGFLQDDSSGMINASVPATSIGGLCFDTVGGTVMGNVDAHGNLNLTFQSGLHLLNIKGTLSADKQSINGTFTTDPFCGGTGAITGFAVQPFTGAYKGSVTNAGGVLNLSFVSSQGSIDSTFGILPLTGTISLTNSGFCTPAQFPASFNFQLIGSAAGAAVNMSAPKGVELPPLIFTGTATDGTATTIKGTIFLDGCLLDVPLILTKQ